MEFDKISILKKTFRIIQVGLNQFSIIKHKPTGVQPCGGQRCSRAMHPDNGKNHRIPPSPV